MSNTETPAAMRSRPAYATLEPRPGGAHFMVADGEGADALIALLAKGGAEMHAKTQIVYMPAPNGSDLSAALEALGVPQLRVAPTYGAARQRIQKVLGDAHMGMQVYTAGTEGLMGQVQRDAIEAGLPHEAVQMEHRGSTARRVQCVHCKGVTENVVLDPFQCSHCGLNLYVRDHYSRRLAAFQGVNIDAEDPGEVPAAVERFK